MTPETQAAIQRAAMIYEEAWRRRAEAMLRIMRIVAEARMRQLRTLDSALSKML